MQAIRVFATCSICGYSDTYLVLDNETDLMYKKCDKCGEIMSIDKINHIHDDCDGNRIEESVVNVKEGN
jgi:translation initiation factor 2 beta subunit (eIF-2beta)/eIF-5